MSEKNFFLFRISQKKLLLIKLVSSHTQQTQSQTQAQPSSQPHESSHYDQQQSGAHHRANSGPTIAISLFPESENSNCKCFQRK